MTKLPTILLLLCAGCAPVPPHTPAAAQPPVRGADAITGLDAHRAVSLRCEHDSDCVVRDIGNCCGTYLACVNTRAQVDPSAVQKECREKDMPGICGWPDISACSCVEGVCQAAGTGMPERGARP